MEDGARESAIVDAADGEEVEEERTDSEMEDADAESCERIDEGEATSVSSMIDDAEERGATGISSIGVGAGTMDAETDDAEALRSSRKEDGEPTRVSDKTDETEDRVAVAAFTVDAETVDEEDAVDVATGSSGDATEEEDGSSEGVTDTARTLFELNDVDPTTGAAFVSCVSVLTPVAERVVVPVTAAVPLNSNTFSQIFHTCLST